MRGTCSGRQLEQNGYEVRFDNCQLVETTAGAQSSSSAHVVAADLARDYEEDIRPFYLPSRGREAKEHAPLAISELSKAWKADPKSLERYRRKVITILAPASRRQARQEVMEESRKHAAVKLLRSVPFLGPLRAAVLVARVQTPHRFRTKRQLWSYCGLALETRSSADYRIQEGELVRRRKPVFVRGLNWNHNHELKNLFKSAATTASVVPGPFCDFYQQRIEAGMAPALARLTLARKIAAIALVIWKKGVGFDAERLNQQAA